MIFYGSPSKLIQVLRLLIASVVGTKISPRLRHLIKLKSKTETEQTVSTSLNHVPEQSSRIFIGVLKYPAPTKVKFTMSGIQSKITRQAEELGNTTHNKKKDQSKDSPPPPAHPHCISRPCHRTHLDPEMHFKAILQFPTRDLLFFLLKRVILGDDREKAQKCSLSILFLC